MSPVIMGYLSVGVALGAALILTPLVRRTAGRLGMVTHPQADRWAKKPTALLGGIAIFASVLLATLVLQPMRSDIGMILLASAFLFVIGLVDDLRQLKPYQKLIGQIMGASLVILGGLTLPWTTSTLFNMALTLVWLVGITNAINLLDNMDGLAAGVSAIAASFLAASFFANDQLVETFLLASFGAALVGFLFYNFNPATIFMGDCGSMFLGFFLASTALLHVSGGRSRGLLAVLGVPVLLLLIPIFDTTLVTVVRKLAGRGISQGGRDHSSHRLVALGLNERCAVGLLYGLTILAGLMAIVVRELPTDVSLCLIVVFSLLLTMLGIHLAGVKVYSKSEERSGAAQPLVAILIDLSYKRRVFEVLLDVVLIGLAYYMANLLVSGPLEEDAAQALLVHALPVLGCCKLATFLGVGVYRGMWRYISLNDLVVYVQAVTVSSGVSLLVLLFLFRFQGFSRVVFILDGLLLLLMVSGSRLGFRLLRGLFARTRDSQGVRALIYGAGDAGELLLREIRNNPKMGYQPIGFADDDPHKKGKRIHGLRVHGGNGSFLSICREQRVDVVLISSTRFSNMRVHEIQRDCETTGVKLKRVRIMIEEVATNEWIHSCTTLSEFET